MSIQKNTQHPNTSYTYCVINKKQQRTLPLVWQSFLSQQTLLLDVVQRESSFYFHSAGLKEQIPQHANTVLEQMAWALLSQPDSDCVIWPLLSSINSQQPLVVVTTKKQVPANITQHGFIALSHHPDPDLSEPSPHKLCYFSRALIADQYLATPPSLSLSRKLKNKLSLEHKLLLIRKFNALRELLSFSRKYKAPVNTCLGRAKSWPAEFARPRLALNPEKTPHKDRIPVLIATHWLELGGAEKFAIDLIKSLPKEQYALYVTTDVASYNNWSVAIIDQVEAVFHLPGFLPLEMMKIFYEYLIRSRDIRLMHIHHAPQAYESLYHIRRFHPQLQILDSLHIIELPPNDGGYVEVSARHFEAFINHHHVISQYLKSFLMQRWLVPENKISVTYLNVDSDYFNPEIVEKGQIRKALNIPDNACLIGFLGRFSQQKQPLEFIKSAQLLQQRWGKTQQTTPLIFLMTGSGLLVDTIKEAIKCAPDTKILLHPQVQDARPIYQDCDVLMMPSENEGLALVSYEAMAMQTPIFFTDVGAQAELLAPEFLIKNTPPIAAKFADAIWPYLINPEKRQRTGEEMRTYIRKHHHHQQTNTQLLTLYQQLLTQA